MSEKIIITTTESIPGYRIVKVLGIVSGSTVRARHIGRDILAGLKNIVGGEISEYTELLADARDEAIRRMIEKARALGANAVVNVRLSSSQVAQGAAEILAYGTAVIVEPE